MLDKYDQLGMDEKLAWNFRDIGHTMREMSEGKGSQKRILMILFESGSITQSELTQKLGIKPGSASEVIGKLEWAGMIKRTPSQSDRRTADLELTDAGKYEAKKAFEERGLRHEKMFSCLNEAEKKTLLSALEKINRSWDENYRKDS